MAERRNPAIHIGQLNLLIPGTSPETGHRVANGIARGLAQKASSGRQRRLGALTVRVQVPAGATTEAEMSGAVAEAIIRVLGK